MEKIRLHIGIDKWTIFAGSYGSTLGLTYAIHYPEKVKRMVLQGIFLANEDDVKWYFQKGISEIYPAEFKIFKDFIPKDEQEDLLKAYHKRFFSNDIKLRNEAIKIWSRFELRTMESEFTWFSEDEVQDYEISLALIEAHYFYNKMFWDDGDYILNRVEKIKNIPIQIAHGRFDLNTRVISAYKLSEKLNNCELIIVEGVGHSPFTKKMSEVLIKFLEDIKEINNGR